MTDKSPQQSNGNAGAQRPGFRGKCLYKTGKCNNERALKTSGAAHNLCDEHRHRQNEHQRKLDAKNRTARKDKRPASGSASPSPKADGASPVNSGATNSAAVRSPHTRYAPYDKNALPHRALRGENGSEDDSKAVHGLAVPPVVATLAGADPTAFTHHETGGSANSTGVVYHMPNGPQPPQMAYPFGLQGFDGIVVPLPSYLEGPERSEFRSRIYQKVLDFISEECVLRFGARPMDKHFQHLQPQQLPLGGSSINSNSSSSSSGTLPSDAQTPAEAAETGTRSSASPAKQRGTTPPKILESTQI